MKHSFSPSISEPDKCRSCKFDSVAHGDKAKCESCDSIGPCNIVFGNILMCPACEAKEMTAQSNLKATADSRVDAQRLIDKSRAIDQSIHIVSDIFNAKMIAIDDLRKSIDADSSIENKHFALAQIIDERYKNLKDVLFETKKQVVDTENDMRAHQQYYNELAKKLRADEREKIKLKDVAYQPTEPTLKKPKAPSVKSFDKAELIKYTNILELEFPAAKGSIMGAIQAIVMTQNVKPEGAANILRNIYGAK